MKRTALALGAAAASLAGCIPHVERGYDAVVPPPPDQRYLPPEASPADQAPIEEEPVRRSVDADEVTKLPAPRPAWEARPVLADAREVPASTYVVARGDTLRRVAERTGAGEQAIARANGLAPPFAIRLGQRLQIPAGRYHLVRPGESGIAIARAYGIEWSRIVAANDLPEPYLLSAGQRIAIPGSADRPPSLAERAAAFRLDIDDILTGGEPAVAANRPPARPVESARRVLPPTVPVAPPARLSGGGFIWPVDGRVVKRFGPGGSGERSNGIKIAVPVGTPIRSVADGVVAYVGDGIAALGGLVIVKHGGGWASVYGHASKLTVQRGQAVKRGQTIALSGDTGFADRPEVHFELRKGRTPVDPQRELPAT